MQRLSKERQCMYVHPQEKQYSQELVSRSTHTNCQLSMLTCFSHWQMRDITNEALRKLYSACIRNSCFPGKLPTDVGEDNVSIHVILQGLGLITATGEYTLSQCVETSVNDIELASLGTSHQFRPPTSTGSLSSHLSGIALNDLPNSLDLSAVAFIDNDFGLGESFVMPFVPELPASEPSLGQTEQTVPAFLPVPNPVSLYSVQSLSYHKHRMALLPTLEVSAT